MTDKKGKAKEMVEVPHEVDVDSMLQPFLTSKEMCFLRVQKLYDLSNKVLSEPTLVPNFKSRVEDLYDLRTEYNRCVKEINSINRLHVPNYVPMYSEVDAFDELYYSVRTVYDMLSLPPPSAQPDNSEHGNNDNSAKAKRRVKLPELQIPKFDSKLENWITFRDTFISLIHNNTALSNIEKFYYLLASVTGPALSIAKSMPITADNYPIVWESFLKRFDNRRALASAYVDKIFTYRSLSIESAANLNNFIQVYQENITALRNLKITDLSEFLLFELAIRNLDPVTRREYEQTTSRDEVPTIGQLLHFVEKQARVLEMSDSRPVYVKPSTPTSKQTAPRSYSSPKVTDTRKPLHTKASFVSAVASKDDIVIERPKANTCPCCHKPHAIYRCDVFSALTPQLRTAKVNELGLCGNCLKGPSPAGAGGHTRVTDCPSRKSCVVCGARHHSSLHVDSVASQRNAVALVSATDTTILLATAIVHVEDAWGRFHDIRAMIDGGSMSSYITKELAQMLGLCSRDLDFLPTALGKIPVDNYGQTTCNIRPRDGSDKVRSTNAVIVDEITGDLPTMALPEKILHTYQHLELADPGFLQCAPVQLLISGDLFPYIYDGEKIFSNIPGMPPALHSIYGYVITGHVDLDLLRERVNAPCRASLSEFPQSHVSDQVDLNQLCEKVNAPCCASFSEFSNSLGSDRVQLNQLREEVNDPCDVPLSEFSNSLDLGQNGSNQLSDEVNARRGNTSSRFSATSDLTTVMNSFWEIENIPSDRPMKPEDVLAETMFANEHTRDPQTGRYIVKYPLRPDHSLGDSRQMALRRLKNLEARLDRDPNLKTEYRKFMNEYESLGHMTCLGEMEEVDSKYLIPHFCIVKPSSTSTKYRCVFDASCRTSNQKSLNDVCLAGPKLQADINVILINFRIHALCLSADICKCYRQTLIHKDQRPYQHILWRDSTDQPIMVYELNTITYGVASSPYLAIKVLHTLADSETAKYPHAAHVLKTAFFMDDLLWSEPSVAEALQLQKDLRALLESAGFVLRKWASNCPQILEAVPEDHRETSIEFDDNLSLKVLGLQWQPANDCFTYRCIPTGQVVTKRAVLSLIGRLFDPLGFVAPCIFYAKCFMQKLWTLKLDWDEKLPDELETEWLAFIKELPLLSDFKHERHVTVPQITYCRIIGFSDASNLGYAGVVYLYTRNDNGDSKTSLLIAKSRVAPIRSISVPRLELMGFYLLSKLVEYVVPILQARSIRVDEQLLFTDSSVVLAWLNTPSYKLKTFVATRVTKVLEAVPSATVLHVSGEHNPCADVLSRGASPSTLLSMPEWLHGPSWLATQQSQWPVRSMDEFKRDIVLELKPLNESKVMVTTNVPSNPIYELSEKCSNYIKLVNVVACIHKFIINCRTSKAKRSTKLSLGDLRQARDTIVKAVQRQHYASDITALSKGQKPQLSLQRLNPFVDENGFLRVGGRLALSKLSFDKKHPLLLPKKCNFTNRLIDHNHIMYMHVGPRTLQGILTQKYWIVSARSVIRLRTRQCIACFKARPITRQPMMGQLPKFRSQDAQTFCAVGLDIGGPFRIKESTLRNARVHKAYLCVYVCCSTRAIFADALTQLSTECFFASYDRFTARRGLSKLLISDNATNFVSAGKQLAEVSEFLQTHADEIFAGFTKREVEWKHNPPTGSHFGGLYEAAIRSCKDLLKRTVADRSLTFEELTTLFARAEAVLNSRPLCALSSDPNEFEILSPAHFLIGRELLSVPEYDLTAIPVHRLNRWQIVQQMSQQFWHSWRKNFLHTLQERQKWFSGCRELKVGDLVLLHSDAPPLQWPLGRITKLHTGADKVTRVVTVRSRNSEFTRPVVKLSPLPLEDDS